VQTGIDAQRHKRKTGGVCTGGLGERKLGLVAGASRDAGAGVKTKERASARRERWLQGWLRVATIFVGSNNPWHSVRDCCKECRAERESRVG
jgi:hypothetical protein